MTSRSRHHPPEPPAAESAADWLVTLKDSAVSRADKEQFVAWLRRSPVHVEEFLRLSSLDAALSSRELGLDLKAAMGDMAPAAMREPITALRPLSQTGSEARQGRVKRFARARWAVAASLLMAVAAALTWYSIGRDRVYTTERGEQRSVSLADGSLMELNTDTRVRVTYTQKMRHIALIRGEAMFTVAKRPQRPFVVDAGGQSIRAIGTRFSVADKSARIVVTVVEGRVGVRPSANSKTHKEVGLSAGQQFDSTAPNPVRAIDAQRATAWQEWKLYFDDVSLGEAVAEFNRYNHQQLRIDDPALVKRRISGVFFANQPDSLLAFIGERESVEVTVGHGDTRIVRLK